MKRLIITLLLTVSAISLIAQDTLTAITEPRTVVSNRYAFSLGELKIADPSLSNQEYKGLIYALEGRHGAFYPSQPQRVSWLVYDRWQYGSLINASYSALTSYFAANLGFGTNCHWHFGKHFGVAAGGIVDFYGAYKSQSRNVNNIGSGDLQLNLLASAAVNGHWQWRKFALQAQYSVATPLIGAFFLPELGQSYYEIYENLPDGLNNIVHFASFHNFQSVKGDAAINLIFSGFTLNLSFRHNHQWWQANNQNCYRKELSGQIGTTIDLELRCGRKSQPLNSVIF